MTRHYLPSFLVSALASTLALAGCGRAPHRSDALSAEKPVPVVTATIERRTTPRTIEVPGTVRPVDRATLAAKVMGTVDTISVALGQRVARGEVLLRISAAEIEARVAQAEARLEQVTRDYEREKGLLAEGASTSAVVRSLESEQRAAVAAVTEARTLLGYTSIVAPFDGVISARPVNEGDLATPGSQLLEIEGTGKLRVETEVPESLDVVATGSPIRIQAAGAEITGTLAEISGASDAQSRTVLAKIDLPSGSQLRSGQFVRARFPAGEDEAILAPVASVTVFGQMERVFVVAQDTAHLRLVRTGLQRGDEVEILAGLNAGERVVVSAPSQLRDGQPVTTTP